MINEIGLFKEEFGDEPQKRLVQAVYTTCHEAARYAYAAMPDFAASVIPSLRRYLLEQEIQNGAWGPTLRVSIKAGHNCSYCLLESPRVALTVVTRSEPASFVEPYRYRETLAQPAQQELFSRGGELRAAEKLYALLQYGGSASSRDPQFVRICFPTVDGSMAPGVVDLLSDHAEFVASIGNVGVVPEPDVRISLTRKPKEA